MEKKITKPEILIKFYENHLDAQLDDGYIREQKDVWIEYDWFKNLVLCKNSIGYKIEDVLEDNQDGKYLPLWKDTEDTYTPEELLSTIEDDLDIITNNFLNYNTL